MKKLLLLLFIASLLTSCAVQKSEKEILDGWLGHTKQTLLLNWGPPSAKYADETIGEIYIYSKEVYYPHPRMPIHYWHHTMMYIKDGKIYSYLTQNNQIPPTQIHLIF